MDRVYSVNDDAKGTVLSLDGTPYELLDGVQAVEELIQRAMSIVFMSSPAGELAMDDATAAVDTLLYLSLSAIRGDIDPEDVRLEWQQHP